MKKFKFDYQVFSVYMVYQKYSELFIRKAKKEVYDSIKSIFAHVLCGRYDRHLVHSC